MRYLLLAAAVLALAAGYGVYYFHVAGAFQAGVADWIAERRSEGLTAEHRGIEPHGFPFRVLLTLDRPHLAAPRLPHRPSWQADRLRLVVQPWDLSHLIVELAGDGRLGLEAGGARHGFDYAVAQGLASYQADAEGRLERFSAELDRLTLAEPGGLALSLAQGQLHARPAGRDGLDLALKLEDLAVDPESLAPERRPLPAFGPKLRRLSVDLTVLGLPRAAQPPAAWLARWRDGGGDLELRHLVLEWGEVAIEAEGTLALDAALRPIGALTAKVKGHRHLIDAALAAGQIGAREAKSARTALDLLAEANGGVLSVPLTLQDGIVSLGPVPLARLAPLPVPAGRSPAPGSPDRRR